MTNGYAKISLIFRKTKSEKLSNLGCCGGRNAKGTSFNNFDLQKVPPNVCLLIIVYYIFSGRVTWMESTDDFPQCAQA